MAVPDSPFEPVYGFLNGSAKLVLDGFMPGERVRLFAYQYNPVDDTLKLLGWQEITMRGDGRMPVEDGRTPCAPTDGQSNPILVSKSLGAFISGFKARVSGCAKRELGMEGMWQRNYYDHIIRDEADLWRIRRYICENPGRWAEDQLHPAAGPNRFNLG